MVRKLVVVFTSVVLFAAAHVKALGLGEIVIESSLNQPFNAQIAFLKLGDVRPEQIQIQMASERDFARFSIDRENFLNTIEFDIQSQGDESYVRLTTDEVVREPYLSFVLETRWPNGRLLNEYTVLLDLPAFASNGNATAIQQAVQADSAPQQSIQNQIPAAASSSSVSQAPARLAAPADEPEAVPVAVEETPEPEVVAEPEVEAGPAVEPEPSTAPRNANASETVTIDSSDTLWDVALQVRPDSTVSVQQTMLALQSLNREAFIGDNINMVRRGQVLRVPTLEQIRALSAREAMSEVARQNQLFDNRRNVPLTSQPITAQPQGATGTAPSRGELSVVSVDNAEPANARAANDSQNAELDARIASLEDALAVQREESDRAALVNEELVARLGLLEEQIASAQEIIRLRDLELAQLQDALAQAEEAVVETPVEEPTVITMAPEKSLVERILDTLVANTFALVALIGLLILMLVFVLLRRNRAAEQAALADIDAMPVEAEEDASDEDDSENVSDDSNLHADIDDDSDEMDELFNIADDADEATDAQIDEDDGYEINDTEEVLFEDEPVAETAIDETPELTTAPVTDDLEITKDIIEEVDALIAYEKIDEAEVALRDAIVAQPDRADLRMKMLEVLVAKQDAVGFKLQETEIRDMDVKGLEPRIATLRSQLDSEVDSEILEEGEDDFFNELNELDDMEVALDLEASAEVDDSKVLSGQVDADEDDENAIEFDDEIKDDAASDDINFDLSVEEKAQLADDFAEDALEEDDISLDLDAEEADKTDLSAEFDLSDEEEPLKPLSDDAAQQSSDENDIDFDFVIEEPEIPNDAVKEPEPIVEAQSAEDSGNEIDFDFDLSDELSDVDAEVEILDETTELPNAHASDEKAKDFDLSVEDDVEIEFLDDDEEDDNIAFDDASFDLSIDEKPSVETPEPAVEAVKAPVDDFDDLQFVDDSLEDNAEEDDEELEDDLDFLSDADEAATKLDLARAYFEMGDVDGAREILEEVVNEGNEEQVTDAKALLEKL
ncbi:MAG: FimV/HubP family polar landmark protein [Gammaproteobacteria bacterium]